MDSFFPIKGFLCKTQAVLTLYRIQISMKVYEVNIYNE